MADSFFTKLALDSFTATEEAARERVFCELQELVKAFSSDTDVRRWIKATTKQDAQKMLNHHLFEGLHAATEYVVQGLMKAGRLDEFSEWWIEYTRLLKRAHAGKEVVATTARPISEKARTALKKTLEKKFEMPVVLTERLNPDLKGGIRLDADDWSYDATLKGRLTRLTQELTT